MPRIILAPLQGVTTPLFRTALASMFTGFDEAMAPFITTTSNGPPPAKHMKEILPENNNNRLKIIPQLLSKEGGDFLEAAKVIVDLCGADEINWNIGCPSGTVTGKKRGAGLLPYPEVIDRFLGVVCAKLSCKLSVKMRLGMIDSREWEALAPILNNYPISEITIHARTGKQQYDGYADVDMFAECKAAIKHPVVYNGDVVSVEFADKIIKRFPDLSGIMVGRGLIANPLLSMSIQNGCEADKKERSIAIFNLHKKMFAQYAEILQGGAFLGRMKELMKYWGPMLSEDERLIRDVLRARCVEDYEEAYKALHNS
ncbi:MAG: tRNA-dihydrouridine synthase family protein [Fibrobacteres bacterium]|nr:tRNA-dihydrouridine synthase family protein [Fibrobacterota bacterium]